MIGQYDLLIVGLSYLVAVLASFTVLEISGKVMQPDSRTSVWVLAGSLAMGTGIWSMHFVGMEALELPITVTYDLPLTILSWVAAVAVSALALWTLSKLRNRPNSLDPKIVVPAGIIMGLGICLMHYSGMFAMRLSPGISYDPLLLAGSFLIAASAAIVTLMIAVKLREVKSFRDLALRGAAAMVMGLAIAGMHYTGMAAATFAPDAVCMTTTGLDAGWTIGPVTIATLIILATAMFFSLRDTRLVNERAEKARREAEEAERRAFEDPDTGLRNRSWLTRTLAQIQPEPGRTVSLVSIEAAGRLTKSESAEFGHWLGAQFGTKENAVVSVGNFALLTDKSADRLVRQLIKAMASTSSLPQADWRVGTATCPGDVNAGFRLLTHARSAAVSIDDFGNDLAPSPA